MGFVVLELVIDHVSGHGKQIGSYRMDFTYSLTFLPNLEKYVLHKVFRVGFVLKDRR